ncbi:hypothetical protein [Roseovarius pacificus]|uniref:hypothetical protein n=1 Tax=Roseovarius pacificus TaxID=337701 RepID=UPI002A18BD51|nr:hypothetical protein [Roseovarius pacificus]
MKVVFERDSVCAGDDVLAPNPIGLSFDQPPFLSELLSQSVVKKYLPSVSGTKTYWTVMCDGEKAAQIEHNGFPNSQAKITYLHQDRVLRIAKVFFRYEKQEPRLD